MRLIVKKSVTPVNDYEEHRARADMVQQAANAYRDRAADQYDGGSNVDAVAQMRDRRFAKFYDAHAEEERNRMRNVAPSSADKNAPVSGGNMRLVCKGIDRLGGKIVGFEKD